MIGSPTFKKTTPTTNAMATITIMPISSSEKASAALTVPVRNNEIINANMRNF